MTDVRNTQTAHPMNRAPRLHLMIASLVSAGVIATAETRATGADGPPPKGWGGTPMNQYKRGTDPDVQRDGQTSVFIESVKGAKPPFGTMTQVFSAEDFAGKRVQYRGYVKTKDVTGIGAGLWLRADDAERRTLQMDNMEKRSVKGTKDWTEVSIVLDVPKEASSFTMGVILAGQGRMWVSGLSFEVVDRSVPVTTEYKVSDFTAHLEEQRKPRNLSFSE